MRKLDYAEFEQKHSRLSSKLTDRACHAIHNQRVVLTAQENPTPTHVLHPRRAVPLLLLGVCEGARSFHDDMEQLMTLSGGFFLREGGDKLHRFQSPVDFLGGRGGVTERFGELLG